MVRKSNKSLFFIFLILGLIIIFPMKSLLAPYGLHFKLIKMICCALLFSALMPIYIAYRKRDAEDISSIETDDRKLIPFFFLISAAVLFLCSTCSPLYAFNIWDDANCFLTMGKAVLKGKVMYRDIYEQKGPLLYFIHSFAALISGKSFLGVYILEIINGTVLMYFAHKTLKLFRKDGCIYLLPIWIAVLFSAQNFVFGDSCEEFALGLVAYPFYIAIKNIKDKRDFSFKEMFLTGVLSGAVLWIKFSIVSFFIGWAIVPIFIYIRDKKYTKLISSFFAIVIGVAAVSAPILIYFVINGAVQDLLTSYFYNNLFIYSNESFQSPLLNYIKPSIKFILTSFPVSMLILGSVFFLAKEKERLLLAHMVAIYTVTTLFIFSFKETYEYYSQILNILSVLGLIPIYSSAERFLQGKSRCSLLVCSLVLACAVGITITQNNTLLKYKKSDIPLYEFADYMHAHKDNPTLFNVEALDVGLYTVADILPDSKFFCKLTIQLEEQDSEHRRIVEEGLADYLVSYDEFEFDKYKLVMHRVIEKVRDRRPHHYYLYERK